MDKEELKKDYEELKYMKLIGRKYGVDGKSIKYWLVKYGLYRPLISEYIQPCNTCGKEIKYRGKYKRNKVHCSQKCSNRRPQKEETRIKISESLKSTKLKNKVKKNCLFCNVDITHKRKKSKFCSRVCGCKYIFNTPEGRDHVLGLHKKSILVQVRRSKNEILFSEKCQQYFERVETNSQIFNGWDADIIIHEHRIAILWNGIWHYKHVRKNSQLDKVQERDRLKLIEIEKCGYTPYVIKDMGRFSNKKVEKEFLSLLNFLSSRSDLNQE